MPMTAGEGGRDILVPGHILVVDDDAASRRLADVCLVAEGHSVETVASGEEGVERFRARTADLVLLDVVMGGIDGFETCRQIRELPRGAGVPIIFMTGHGDTGTQRRALAAGGNDFLTKPVSTAELVTRVHLLLASRRMSADLDEGARLLETQREILVAVQKRKDDLSQLIVHDLRSPLAGIRANIEAAQSERGLSDDVATSLNHALVGVRALERLITNLGEVTRADDGRLTPRQNAVDLRRLAEEAGQAIEPRLRVRQQRLSLEIGSIPAVRGDRDLVLRILDNLLENAALYGPKAGLIILGARDAGDGFVELWVDDQGPPVPAAERDRVFQKYASLNRTARTGRGLSLLFCRVAAEAHGGRIWIEDAAAGGVSFRVRLPTGS
jgi:two-component system, sensor histidine kinase and response regulator